MATSQQAQPPRGWLPHEREHLAAADLHLAALSSAPLPGADLRQANLHEAWLRDSCLHAADLREVDCTAPTWKARIWTLPTCRV